MKIMSLSHYIKKYYGESHGAKAVFAKSHGVNRQQVNKWLKDKFDVILSDDALPKLVSERRTLNKVAKVKNCYSEHPFRLDNYPFYKKLQGEEKPQPAYLLLDIRSGAVNTFVQLYSVNAEESESFSQTIKDGLILAFKLPELALIQKNEMNDLINEYLPRFQSVLSVYNVVTVEDGESTKKIGALAQGYEGSNIISELVADIEHELKQLVHEGVYTNLEHAIEPQSLFPLGGLTLEDKIDKAMRNKEIAGFDDSDIWGYVLDVLVEEFFLCFDEEGYIESNPDKVKVLYRVSKNDEYPFDNGKDIIEDAYNKIIAIENNYSDQQVGK